MSSNPGSFIPSQTIRRLEVPGGQEPNLLAYFQGRGISPVGLVGQSDGNHDSPFDYDPPFGDANDDRGDERDSGRRDARRLAFPLAALGAAERFRNAELEQLDKIWPTVDRFDFLSDLKHRRIVVSDIAGVGKSTVVRQLQFQIQKEHPQHLVMRFDLKDIPESPLQFVSQVRGSLKPLLIQHAMEVFAEIEKAALRNNSRPFIGPGDVQVRTYVESCLRRGEFTLIVDGVDQINLDVAKSRAGIVRSFLRLYPDIRCVVAGRPFAVSEIWGDAESGLNLGELTGGEVRPVWEFINIDRYTDEQVREYLGAKAVSAAAKLDADEIRLPRTANVIRKIPHSKLSQMRTSSDLYWYAQNESISDSLDAQSDNNQVNLKLGEVIAVSAAVAFGLWTWKSTPVMHAPLSQGDGDSYLDFRKHMRSKGLDARLKMDGIVVDTILEHLAQVNTDPIRAGFYSRTTGMTGIEFSDATIRDFYAAHWAARYLDTDCHEEGEPVWKVAQNLMANRQSKVFRYPEKSSFNPLHDKMWKLLIGMPRTSLEEKHPQPSSRDSFVRSVTPLFESNRHLNHPRPTELMWLVWPRLLDWAGVLRTGNAAEFLLRNQFPDEEVGDHDLGVSELAVQVATTGLQNRARRAIETGKTVKANNSAATLLIEFLSEFPRLVANGTKTARWFDSSFSDIPAGPFLYGDDAEHKKIHRGFQLCKYQLTNHVYDLFDTHHRVGFVHYEIYSSEPLCAAIYKTFFDASVYSLWAGGFLPTDTQWEAACRGKVGKLDAPHTKFYFGNEDAEVQKYSWIDDNSQRRVHPVGEFTAPPVPHPYGLFDVHGNAWEWMSNGIADSVGRSLRGGSFLSFARNARCSYRLHYGPANAFNNFSCRVARARKP